MSRPVGAIVLDLPAVQRYDPIQKDKTATSKSAVPPVRGIRKNMRMDQRKLDQVRKILGARTETEAVERAMDEVIFRERAVAGIAKLVGRGGFRPLPDDES